MAAASGERTVSHLPAEGVFGMTGTTLKTWKFDLGVSTLLHAAVVLLGAAVIGMTGAPRTVMTVVLDGRPFFTAGDSRGAGSPRLERPAKPKSSTPAERISAPVKTEERRRDTKTMRQPVPAPAVDVTSEPVVSAEPIRGNTGPETGRGREMDLDSITGAGTGGSDIPASGRGVPGTGGDAGGRAAYLKEHFNYIRDLITRNLAYPAVARRMGWKGQMIVSFVICEGGRVENIRILKSSGHRILDENAVNTIKRIQPFPKPPVKAEIVIPIAYQFG